MEEELQGGLEQKNIWTGASRSVSRSEHSCSSFTSFLLPDRENHDEAAQAVKVELGLQTPKHPILLIYNEQHICPRLLNRWITHTARF